MEFDGGGRKEFQWALIGEGAPKDKGYKKLLTECTLRTRVNRELAQQIRHAHQNQIAFRSIERGARDLAAAACGICRFI